MFKAQPEPTAGETALETELKAASGSGGEGSSGAAAPAAEAGKGKEAPAAKAQEAGKGKEAPAGKEEDPEIDLSKFGLGKVKKSQLTAWQKGGMQEEDYRKKTEELSQREAQIKDLLELSDFLAKNPKKLQKVLGVLEDASEAAEGAADAAKAGDAAGAKKQAEDAQAAIKAILEKIDPEDPAGVLLKTMYQEMGEIKKVMSHFLKKDQDLETRAAAAEKQTAVKTAQDLLGTTLSELEKNLEFESDEEKGPWRQMVLTHLVNNPKNYATKEDFAKAIKEIGEKQYRAVRAIAEAALKKHLAGKGGPKLPGPGAGGDGAPVGVTMGNLQEVLEKELNELNK